MKMITTNNVRYLMVLKKPRSESGSELAIWLALTFGLKLLASLFFDFGNIEVLSSSETMPNCFTLAFAL
jgi:hypothetical protein